MNPIHPKRMAQKIRVEYILKKWYKILSEIDSIEKMHDSKK
jgi:hypothetical protein